MIVMIVMIAMIVRVEESNSVGGIEPFISVNLKVLRFTGSEVDLRCCCLENLE